MNVRCISIVFFSLLFAGCQQIAQQQARDREVLVQRFQAAYPETWQQKLLEYDLQEQQRRRDEWQKALDRNRRQMEMYQNQRPTHIYPDGGGGYIIYE